jgi:hypothetical protein
MNGIAVIGAWNKVAVKDMVLKRENAFDGKVRYNYSATQHINLITFTDESYIDCEWKSGTLDLIPNAAPERIP